MSDTYEIEPGFVDQKPTRRQPPKLASVSTHVPVQVSSSTPESSQVQTTDWVSKNKTLIIVAVAVVIALIICAAYWYFSGTKETHSNSPPKKPPQADNVPPVNIEHVHPKPESRSDSKPESRSDSKPEQKQGVVVKDSPRKSQSILDSPVTHEDLILNADDAEIDKYMNPGEPVYDESEPTTDKYSGKLKRSSKPDQDEPKPKSSEDISPKVENVEPDLLDDLEDLED